MKVRDLVKELERLGYEVDYIFAIGRFKVNNTKIKVEVSVENGYSYGYFGWLPISYIIWSIEKKFCNLGYYSPYFNEFNPNGADIDVLPPYSVKEYYRDI